MEFFTFELQNFFFSFYLVCFFQVGLSTSEAKVRDLFEHRDLGIYKKSFIVQDSVVIKKVNEDLRLSSSPSVPSICGECIEGSYQNDYGYG